MIYLKILVEFILISEKFPVNEVKQQIGILDCEIIYSGDVVYYGTDKQCKRIECFDSITYSTGYIETNKVADVLNQIKQILYEKKIAIRNQIEKYSLLSKFWITISLSDNPIIELPADFVDFASYLKATIEFDTYL